MIRVCLLIRQLNLGGAQRQLVALAKALDKERYEVTVVSFYSGGHFATALEAEDRVRFISLDKQGRWDLVGFLWRFSRVIRRLDSHICYSFLGGSNLLSILARFLCPNLRLIWSIRGSEVDFRQYDWAEWLTSSLENFFSRYADRIIANSSAGMAKATANGFPDERITVVANGIDTEYFRPEAALRRSFRSRLGISEEVPLVGMVARPDPMKGHEIFLQAASLLKERFPRVHFLICGCEEGELALKLKDLSNDLDIDGCCTWLPREKEMPSLYNALDLLVSASLYGEGFGNVIAEGMSCGVPCVATDVGDSKMIVGPTGQVVCPGSAEALAEGMTEALTLLEEGRTDPSAIRQSIVDKFGVENMVQSTEKLFCTL